MLSTVKHAGFEMSWSVLILKILAAHPDGRATADQIVQHLTVLSLSNLPKPPAIGCIFKEKLVTLPQRGVWQLTARGRAVVDYLRL